MPVISNAEFEVLTEGQSNRLHAIAKARWEKEPRGVVNEEDIYRMIELCAYSGDRPAATWLKNLMVLHRNGALTRIRTNTTNYEDHLASVHVQYAAKEIPFDIGQHVQCKQSGKYGSVVDYIPRTDEYLVLLDPFQVKTYKKDELSQVA